jgi:hypothetical protein
MLVAPAAARADMSLSNVVARPIADGAACQTDPAPDVDAPAGAHRDLCIAFDTATADGDDLKDLTIHMAPGLIGDPSAAPLCPQDTFRTGTCPADTQVGDVATTALIDGSTTTLPLTGSVFNVAPNADEPARLGIFVPVGPVRLEASIRTRVGDYGLDSVTKDIPNVALGVLPITIQKMALRLWGAPAAHPSLAKGYITLPTSCDAATTAVAITAYNGAGDSQDAGFTPTDCEHVPFAPSLEVAPKQVPADTPGDLTVTLNVPGAETDGRVQSQVKRVVTVLPKGLTLSPGLANGLTACNDDDFGLNSDSAPRCADSSKIGDVTFDTPIIGTLHGSIYLGTPAAGAQLRNFVSVEDPRLRVKLLANITADPQTGQITAEFPSTPQVPFTSFRLHYQGGARAVFSSPSACGTSTAQATVTPYSGAPSAAATDSFDTVDCAHGFAPSLSVSSSTTAAGSDTAVTVRMDRPDRQANLLRSKVSLPPGLVGRLASVPQCPVATARAAGCGEDSRVGSAQIVVGNGAEPLALDARVYLTQGFDGSLAGLAIVPPSKVGPFDVGTAVTLAKLSLRGADAGIDVETEDLPQLLGGIPTPYRTVALTIDRAGFMSNPTSCAVLPAHGVFTGAGGEQAAADTTYQATGCDSQPYAPQFAATLGAPGATAKRAHVPLTTTITQKQGEANSERVTVTLPGGIGADAAALKRACPQANLAAGTCPASAKVGRISATSTLLPFPLTGDVLMVRPASGTLPELSLELPLGLRLRATVALTQGHLQTVFPAVPDVPLTQLKVSFDGGRNGVLVTSKDLCRTTSTFGAAFVSHGGAKRTARVAPTLPCGRRMSVSASLAGIKSARPTVRLTVASAVAKLREVRVALPRQLRAAPSATLKRTVRVLAGGKRVTRPSVKMSGGKLVIGGLPKGGTRTVVLSLRSGALRKRSPVKAGSHLTLKVEGRPMTGKLLQASARATAR